MRDFPIFTTENGVASLVLREIPYRQCAYIKLIDTLEPEKLLEECRQFCAAVGAEHIYAAGAECLKKYPLYTSIREMERIWTGIPETKAVAVPVTAQDLSRWKDLYNNKMVSVPNAAYMNDAMAKQMLADGSGYYVYLDDRMIGIGKGSGHKVEAVASVQPGAGKNVVLALCRALGGSRFRLEVADSNTGAVALYERMGFVKTREISRWYHIL